MQVTISGKKGINYKDVKDFHFVGMSSMSSKIKYIIKKIKRPNDYFFVLSPVNHFTNGSCDISFQFFGISDLVYHYVKLGCDVVVFDTLTELAKWAEEK